MFNFIWGVIRGVFFGAAMAIALVFILLSLLAPEAKSEDLVCIDSLWGETVCRPTSDKARYVIKENIWEEKEVRRDGILVARCKKTLWNELTCEEK